MVSKIKRKQTKGGGDDEENDTPIPDMPMDLLHMILLASTFNPQDPECAHSLSCNKETVLRNRENLEREQTKQIKLYALLGEISRTVSRFIPPKQVLTINAQLKVFPMWTNVLIANIIRYYPTRMFNDTYLHIQYLSAKVPSSELFFKNFFLPNNTLLLSLSDSSDTSGLHDALKSITEDIKIKPCLLVLQLYNVKFENLPDSLLENLLNSPKVWASINMQINSAIGHIVCMNRILYWYMQSVGVGEIFEDFSKRFIHYLGLRRALFTKDHHFYTDIRIDTIVHEEIFAYGEKVIIQNNLNFETEDDYDKNPNLKKMPFNSNWHTYKELLLPRFDTPVIDGFLTIKTSEEWKMIFKYIETLAVVVEGIKFTRGVNKDKFMERIYTGKHLSIVKKFKTMANITVPAVKPYVTLNDNTNAKATPKDLAGLCESFYFSMKPFWDL
jgi:hypothetical protein